jgi:parallel beta-helix repeat protein
LIRLPMFRRLLAVGVALAIVAGAGAVVLYRRRPPPPIPPSTNTVQPGSFRVDGPTAFPSAACADTSRGLFVSTTGNDASPGTIGQPYRTIEFGLKNLARGQTLFIRAGKYYNLAPDGRTDALIVVTQRGTGVADDQWLTVCGYPGERPQLYANDTDVGAALVEATDRVHIEGLELIGAADGLSRAPKRGGDAKGVWVGHFPYLDTEARHVRVWNNWIHGFGASGVQTNLANDVDIRGNRIWDNAHWSDFATSGISIFRPAARIDAVDPYGTYIVGNLLWNNYMDDSLYNPQNVNGLTDGNCIIIDENGHYTDRSQSRTLIRNNICVDNGGPGVAMTRSQNAEIVDNTFYLDNRTSKRTVVSHGEFMCQGMSGYETADYPPVAGDDASHRFYTPCVDVTFRNNVVVGRPDRKYLFQHYNRWRVEFGGNVWVKDGFVAPSVDDTALAAATMVLRRPDTRDPTTADWTSTGAAAGKGAAWPLDTR